MNFLNLLPSLGQALPALLGGGQDPSALLPPPGGSPGFAGGHFGGARQAPQIDMMSGINQALASNQAQQPTQKPGRIPGTPKPFLHALGMIGDALIQWRGGQPVYQPWVRQQQTSAAMGNYLDDPEGAIRALMAVDPQTAIQLHQSRQGKTPEEIALMKMVGIDPASDEGREIIKSRLMGRQSSNDPNFVRELEALGIDPRSDEARELYYGRNSPAGYLLRPKGRSSGPAATNGPQVGAVVNGFRFRGGNPNDKANWEPANGGPTASPSGAFPAPGN